MIPIGQKDKINERWIKVEMMKKIILGAIVGLVLSSGVASAEFLECTVEFKTRQGHDFSYTYKIVVPNKEPDLYDAIVSDDKVIKVKNKVLIGHIEERGKSSLLKPKMYDLYITQKPTSEWALKAHYYSGRVFNTIEYHGFSEDKYFVHYDDYYRVAKVGSCK